MEITKELAKALIHSGPCEKAKEEFTRVRFGYERPRVLGSFTEKGLCSYCDLVRAIREDDAIEYDARLEEFRKEDKGLSEE